MSTSVEKDDWSSATLYAGGQPVAPPIPADPFGTLFFPDPGEDGDGHDIWGTTTYVGRPRKRRGRDAEPASPAGPAGADSSTSAGSSVAGVEGLAEMPVPDALADSSVGLDPVVAAADGSLDAGVAATSAVSAAERAERSDRRLLAASSSMAVASLTSRVTGFVRTALLVAALGVGAVGNAYNSGNNFPNMIYELLLGGVLSSVLIPLLVHAQSQDDDDGVAYTQRLLSLAAAALAVITMAAVLAAPLIATAFVPANLGAQRHLTSIFATLLLPEIFFYGMGAVFMAVLNIRHSYRPGAWAPVLNNVVMIVTVAVFWALPGPDTLDPTTMTNAQILVIGIGTTLGIAAQALILIPSLRKTGFHWQWRFRARPNEAGRLKEVGRLALWVLAYVAISQVGVSVIQYYGIKNGGFSVFTWADLLFQMPYGILVVSLLTAIMPRMSRAAVRGDDDAVRADLALGSRLSAVALLPVTAGLIALGSALTVTIFAYGKTSILEAHLIGSSLAWSAFGLFPFAIVMLQLRVFYAMRDGRTPTLINAFMVATKVALIVVTNIMYKAPDGVSVNHHPSADAVEWLNIATSVSYVVGAVVGQIVLTRRLGRLEMTPILRTLVQMVVASALGGVAAYAVVIGLRHALGAARLGSALGLILGAIVGLAVFAVVAWRMRNEDVRRVMGTLRRA